MRIIQHVDPTGNTIVARVPASGTDAIELGSQLIVEESQQAVFFRDGKALDTFGPGRMRLSPQILSSASRRRSKIWITSALISSSPCSMKINR